MLLGGEEDLSEVGGRELRRVRRAVILEDFEGDFEEPSSMDAILEGDFNIVMKLLVLKDDITVVITWGKY